MKTGTLLVFLVSISLLAYAQSKKPAKKSATVDGPEVPYLRVIAAKCKELQKLGRVAQGFDCSMIIGRYGWHGGYSRGAVDGAFEVKSGMGYFGTYEFYQPAFEQAKKGWWGFHGTVIEGNDELWIADNSISEWCGTSAVVGDLAPGQSSIITFGAVTSSQQCGHDPYPIVFDSSVIGRSIDSMNMAYVDKDGKYRNDWFSAKVVAIIDGKDLKLDRRASHHAEQFKMSIPPDNYVEMCDCINNFGPQLVDGQPVVLP